MILHYLLIASAVFLAVISSEFTVNVSNITAKIDVLVDGKPWILSGDIFITSGGKKYCLSDGSLKVESVNSEMGRDVLGMWRLTRFSIRPKDAMFTWHALVKSYLDHPTVLFGQHFPDEVTGTSVKDANAVMTGFPSIMVDPSQDLGYLAYGGIMVGDTKKSIGRWHKDTSGISSGLDSGPLVLFDDNNNAVVMSSFSNPMSGSAVYEKSPMGTMATWGLMGMAESIPKNFSYWTILHYSDSGINMALDGWGSLMRKYYNKETYFRDSDFVNNYLGYWTDNGAYYYYITEPGKNYEDTIIDVYNYAKKMNIPYRYVQYDSWWYPKGDDGGVTEWTPTKSVFPDGLGYLWEKTGWPVIAHNRWWSSETPYAKMNGGKYNFVVEKNTSKHAVPLDMTFWDDLLRTSKEWGLLTYEQDWLNTEFDGSDITRMDLTVGRTWLLQMGKGAAINDMTVQYCMAPSRHVLQSLEIPVVTQARVSDDYQPGNDQWKIGVSSIFAHQMAIAPYKDNFWTTSNQTGNFYNKWEPYPRLQSVVSTLSTGPVGPSDKIDHSDVKLIMKSCNTDGLLLKPDKPAMALDKQIQMMAYSGFSGEVWATHSTISDWMFPILFAADFSSSEAVKVTPADLGWRDSFMKYKIYSSPEKIMDFSNTSALMLKGCTKQDFCLYYFTPVLMVNNKELVLLGEMDKWVPMSSKRFSAINVSPKVVRIELTGGVGEMVDFMYMYDNKLMTATSTIAEDGTAKLHIY